MLSTISTIHHEIRQEYGRARLMEPALHADPHTDPIERFAAWLGEAVAAGLHEPNAMTLATAAAQGRPSARMVLLKDFDARGFCFYTNYESRKGRELAENPWAALVFWWGPLERQVRIEGQVHRLTEAESDAYFATRPLGSRLAAWISPQSQVIADRAFLETRLAALQAEYADVPPPRPSHWGGYRLTPTAIEFWQGGPHRLHDRLRYTRAAGDVWTIERLSP
jgi:pyridoxamine 5'-phosphate oxidase